MCHNTSTYLWIHSLRTYCSHYHLSYLSLFYCVTCFCLPSMQLFCFCLCFIGKSTWTFQGMLPCTRCIPTQTHKPLLRHAAGKLISKVALGFCVKSHAYTHIVTGTHGPLRPHSLHSVGTQLDIMAAGAIDRLQMNGWEKESEREKKNVWRGVIVCETECCHTSTPTFSPSQINTSFVFFHTLL